MIARSRVTLGGNEVFSQGPGQSVMCQLQYEANTTVGASTLTVSSILAGIINRSGSVAGYIDTLPAVSSLIAAVPNLSPGDSFTFRIRNTVAFILTLAVGTGWTLGSNTAIAASLVREYLVTMVSTNPPSTFTATTTNASPILTNISAASLALLQPGMVLSGTGVAASQTIIAVNANARTVTMSANASATGDVIAITANPTATVEGVCSTTL